jgi:hypothetical protein
MGKVMPVFKLCLMMIFFQSAIAALVSIIIWLFDSSGHSYPEMFPIGVVIDVLVLIIALSLVFGLWLFWRLKNSGDT